MIQLHIMRLRKAMVIVGSFLVLTIIFTVYTANMTLSKKDELTTQKLRDVIVVNFDTVDEIQISRRNTLQPSLTSPTENEKQKLPVIRPNIQGKTKPKRDELNTLVTEMIYNKDECPIQLEIVPKTDIQMLELYKSMPFDNIEGGVWKQGWNIEVDEKDWNENNKLKVFVVPHSHNDPGWTKTVDEYYAIHTKSILDNMVLKLPEDPRRKFIWAEMCYFSMWWDDIGEEEKEKVKRLIQNNQLEIVTGGWVMNDEANSHWLSITYQLTEGHQWLQKNVNYTPKSSWSIDPFGLSLTQPMLLKKMGMKNLLIHRVHYAVKKQLASKQQLEFRWRQLWDGTGKTDIFTPIMPFFGYDTPYTCGPDPKVCCQFDFQRLLDQELQCPCGIAPQAINDENVAYRLAYVF